MSFLVGDKSILYVFLRKIVDIVSVCFTKRKRAFSLVGKRGMIDNIKSIVYYF